MIRPVFLSWRAKYVENFGKLVEVGSSGKKSAPAQKLCCDAADWPDVDSLIIQELCSFDLNLPVLYWRAPNMSSGHLYHLVTTWCVSSRLGEPNAFARPKSPSFTTPWMSISKLSGLRSRWSTKFACKYSSPRSVAIRKAFVCAGVIMMLLSRIRSTNRCQIMDWWGFLPARSVSIKSRTSEIFDFCPKTSTSSIIFSCFSSCSNFISLSAVLLIPSRASLLSPSLKVLREGRKIFKYLDLFDGYNSTMRVKQILGFVNCGESTFAEKVDPFISSTPNKGHLKIDTSI